MTITNEISIENNQELENLDLNGYDSEDQFWATQTTQGNRLHYALAVQIQNLPVMFPEPDPDKELDDNRLVKRSRAKEFAEYVKLNESWHAGPLTIRTNSSVVRFEAQVEYGSSKIGILYVPRNSRGSFRIIDGQHRQLGFITLLRNLSEEIISCRQKILDAEKIGQPKELIHSFNEELKLLEKRSKRICQESVCVDLLIEDDKNRARQLFVDVANNALGVSGAVTARFDQRKVANRTLGIFLSREGSHPFLDGKVDTQKDIVTGGNKNFIGAGTLADLIKIVEKGISGRFTKKIDLEADETILYRKTSEFFDVLMGSFSDLNQLATGVITPKELRESSLLGSKTFLRVIAGVYYELMQKGESAQSIASYFRSLNDHMSVPISKSTESGKIWLSVGDGDTSAFDEGANSPIARSQNVKMLISTLVEWFDNPPKGL